MAGIKIMNVVGARPNFVKIAPLMAQMRRHRSIDPMLVHTGQHYDRNMSSVFFRDLALREPDVHLAVGSGTHAQQTARVMTKLEKLLLREAPDMVVVVGDVNSTMAAALTAAKLNIPVAHVEAGLRSFDRTMPEEINRVVTDHLSDYLFAPSRDAVENLAKEGIAGDKIFFTGNIMIDTLRSHRSRIKRSNILKRLNLEKNGYVVLTLHRPVNVDKKEDFVKILMAVEYIQRRIKIAFPIHVRTKKMLKKHRLFSWLERMENVVLRAPLGYLDFLKLLSESRLVITDSGGIQEETTALGIPCVTIRTSTERPITIGEGTNTLVRARAAAIVKTVTDLLRMGLSAKRVPKLWDGNTAKRIVKILLRQGRVIR